MKRHLTHFVATFIVAISCYSCSLGNSSISSREDAEKYLEGKTFSATPAGGVWYKLSFNNNSCTLQSGVPQYVGWNNTYSGRYEIKKERYQSTGKTYYYVKFGNTEGFNCFMFNLDDQSLYVCSNGQSPLAQMKIGDANPWD